MWITLVMMVLEIVAGLAFNSMALLADGWHMATHAFAIGLAAFAYAMARRFAGDRRFAFGTWKIEILASFTSACSCWRWRQRWSMSRSPTCCHRCRSALPRRCWWRRSGLLINVACALILGNAHDHDHGHPTRMRAPLARARPQPEVGLHARDRATRRPRC